MGMLIATCAKKAFLSRKFFQSREPRSSFTVWKKVRQSAPHCICHIHNCNSNQCLRVKILCYLKLLLVTQISLFCFLLSYVNSSILLVTNHTRIFKLSVCYCTRLQRQSDPYYLTWSRLVLTTLDTLLRPLLQIGKRTDGHLRKNAIFTLRDFLWRN